MIEEINCTFLSLCYTIIHTRGNQIEAYQQDEIKSYKASFQTLHFQEAGKRKAC
jgi:hypothetical protein